MADSLPTSLDLLAVTQRSLRQSLDPNGTGAVDLNPGSRLDIFQSCVLAIGARITAHVANRIAARSKQTSTGDDLDVIGQDIYNTKRKVANAATGTLYLRRAGSSATVIPFGSRFAVPAAGSQQSVTYAASGDVPASTTYVAVPVQCAAVGATGNLQLAAVTKVVDTLPDTTWSLYVPTAGDPVLAGAAALDVIAGGDDGEVGNDAAFLARLNQSSFDAANAPGTYGGIKQAVLEVPGIADATIISPGDGTIRVFAGDINYQLSNALKTNVQAAVDAIRAFGNPSFVLPYTVVAVPIVGFIYMRRQVRNYDSSAISAQAVANVIDYFATGRESPDSYFTDKISASMESAHAETQSVVLSAPTSSVPPLPVLSYSALSTINRYVTDTAHVSVAVLDPQTS